jgi:hypothetical protein
VKNCETNNFNFNPVNLILDLSFPPLRLNQSHAVLINAKSCQLSFSKRRIHLLPQTCTILTDEGKVNMLGSSSYQGCTLWIVHGTCAAHGLYWFPWKSGSSLLRHFTRTVCFPTTMRIWCEFYCALNILAILLMVFAFSIAVYVIG